MRRLLLQAAWLYMRRSAIGRGLRARREGQPEAVITIADAARAGWLPSFARSHANSESLQVPSTHAAARYELDVPQLQQVGLQSE